MQEKEISRDWEREGTARERERERSGDLRERVRGERDLGERGDFQREIGTREFVRERERERERNREI